MAYPPASNTLGTPGERETDTILGDGEVALLPSHQSADDELELDELK
jgi:hypothetical protein